MVKVLLSLPLLAATARGAVNFDLKNLDGLFKGDMFKLPDYSSVKERTSKNKDLPTCQTANIDCTGLGARMNWLACIPEGYKIPPGKEEEMRGLEACTQAFCCGAATCASSVPADGFGCFTEGLNNYDSSIKGDDLCPEGVEEGCTGDLTVCCEPATCQSALPSGGNGYDCASVDLNNFDPSKRGSVQCPGGLASGCRGDLTVCCEPATCQSAVPSSGYGCATVGFNNFDVTLKGSVICPGGTADGCLDDLSVCCEPATCGSANGLDTFGCSDAGLNNYDPDFKSGVTCPEGEPSQCLNDPNVCCQPATCASALPMTGFGCSSQGFSGFDTSAVGSKLCPGGTAAGCRQDLSVCCGPATCQTTNQQNSGLGCGGANGFNNFILDRSVR
uniref:Uncharacterized protein n=1 Tax=Chromera velia CCMP2878 TaxID=1169474 RepID=A0A0G4HSU7_9ALVE|eukprot:Cvel_31185.t1-p1 / transcript=Cvel_31185.t1 / gene=Cvel_31185 / organism=Chromera_velia_CCMP2878 / gene_product=hypothetical protein / transcript_product=hypothetical protein / location=Cvel_scaffold4597:5876-8281(+) / protein_length=387 / sequence_SO=supercontig / SO=protein_coding / is_pseudo=false